VEQITELLEGGINEFHFYTLNRAGLTAAICHSIGLKPDGRPEAGQHAHPQQTTSEATA